MSQLIVLVGWRVFIEFSTCPLVYIDLCGSLCSHVWMKGIDKRTQQGLVWLAVAIGVAVLTGILGYQQSTPDHKPIVSALIWTGRLAFLIFLIPLFARPLYTLFKSPLTTTLMRWRRNAGIVYGGIQSVHLVIVCMMFLTLSDPPTETIMVIVGSTGLILSLAMLVTSFPRPTRLVGPTLWKRIHNAGFYIFMTIYVYDFVIEPILFDRPTSHLLWATLTLCGILVRTLVLVQSRFKLQAT